MRRDPIARAVRAVLLFNGRINRAARVVDDDLGIKDVVALPVTSVEYTIAVNAM